VVESRVHLFGVTIGAVTIQGDTDLPDEFMQTRLVVRSNTLLRVSACAAHTATLGHVRETRPSRPHVALVLFEPPHRWEARRFLGRQVSLDQARLDFGDLTFSESNVGR
jgi:hypothetical protein